MTVDEAMKTAVDLHRAGELHQAERLYRQILEHCPGHAGALHLLGLIAHQSGHHQAAIDLIGRSLAVEPNDADAHCNLGAALYAEGRLNDAIASYRAALSRRPDFADAHNNLGAALKDKGLLDEAMESYRRALGLRPGYAEALNNLGNALAEKGDTAGAERSYRLALAARPSYAEAENNLGNVVRDSGLLDEAIKHYHRALELNPRYADAHNNLGNALKDAGQLDAAVGCFRAAIELRPSVAGIHCNLGDALRELGTFDEAMLCYDRAIALDAQYVDAHINRGNLFKDQSQLDDAIAAYRRAMELKPQAETIHSNLVYTLYFQPDATGALLPTEHRRWFETHARSLSQSNPVHSHSPDPRRRLRIGYISPDFYRQAEAFFVLPLLEAHSHRDFEIHCYSSVLRPDDITQRMKSKVDVWHDVRSLSDEQLASKVRADGIDILVDLTMHMARSRLLTFARKPAPVQVTWLAYPGSTGLPAMDYRLTDAAMDPPEVGDRWYVEQAVRLPDSWCCYAPLDPMPPIGPLPSRKRGHITFGSLNNFCKMNDQVLRLWAATMNRIEQSTLLLLAHDGAHGRRTESFMSQHGIGAGRLRFERPRARTAYLRLYDEIDVGLDPFPYNGITTTCDALNMGVPVLSLAGTTTAARAGLSLLTAAGLSEFAANSEDQFISLAVELCRDGERLAHLRSTLRDRVAASPLMDAPRFASNVEAAYRSMWARWCERRGLQ